MIEICCWHYCNNKFSPGAGAVVAPRVARTRLAQWEMTAKAVMLRCCGECPVQSRTVHTWWHVGSGHHGLVHTCEAMGWSTHGHVWPGQQDTHWASPCAPTWLLAPHVTRVPDWARDNDQCYSLTRVTSTEHARYTRNNRLTQMDSSSTGWFSWPSLLLFLSKWWLY